MGFNYTPFIASFFYDKDPLLLAPTYTSKLGSGSFTLGLVQSFSTKESE